MTSAIDRSRVRVRAGHVLVLVLLATGALAAVPIFLFSQSGAWLTPQTVVKHYVTNVYASDYNRAYELLSAADKAVKSRDESRCCAVRLGGDFSVGYWGTKLDSATSSSISLGTMASTGQTAKQSSKSQHRSWSIT